MPKASTIRIIPKARPKAPTWMNALLGAAVFLFVAVLIVLLVLHFQSVSAEQRYLDAEQERNKFETDDLKMLEIVVTATSRKIADFNDLLKQHSYTSKIFWLLKRNCHPKTQFSDFDFTAENYQLSISGITDNFRALGEQLLILLIDGDVQDLKMTTVGLDDSGNVSFGLSFFIQPGFLKP